MELELLNDDNIDIAIKIQREIFPLENGSEDLKEALADAWLGWFGVVEDERRKGFGTQILNDTMQIARDMGFDTLRLYTDEEENDIAIKLYEKIGMIREIYNNPEDVHFEIGNTLIFSKGLINEKTTLWNNKNLFLNSHEEKNKE